MGHPAIDEMYRCYSLSNVRNESFRRWQRELHDQVNPVWDDYQRLLAENAALKAEIAELTEKAGKRTKKEPATV